MFRIKDRVHVWFGVEKLIESIMDFESVFTLVSHYNENCQKIH